MYFLNGDRRYIKPENGCGTILGQFRNCLSQLKQINSGQKIFKLNFFVDTTSDNAYTELTEKIGQEISAAFSEDIILNFIAQPPLTRRIVIEAFFFNPQQWQVRFISHENSSAMLFQKEETRILIGNVQANQSSGCRQNAELVFTNLYEMFRGVNLPVSSIIRQWNYVENILGFDGARQRYQEFNNIRAEFYGKNFEKNGYPAATGIGMNRGGVIVEFVAVQSKNSKSVSLNNPRQVAAHLYSPKVLVGKEQDIKCTPRFERAKYFELFGKKMIFISGTASIIGEKTIGAGDAVEQTRVTVQNIRQLYSDEILAGIAEKIPEPKYGHARIYVKNRKDFASIKRTFKKYFGNLPVVYIVADICREDLLVEIEGKVILE